MSFTRPATSAALSLSLTGSMARSGPCPTGDLGRNARSEQRSNEDLQRLITMILRRSAFAEGTLAHAIEQGWIHRILDRMRTISA